MSIKIGFHSNQLSVRGTEVALFSYADYNETVLGNESFIFIPNQASDRTATTKFTDRFKNIRGYNVFPQLVKSCEDLKIDVMYWIKSGQNNEKLIPGIKNVVHAVFDGSQPHSDRYAAVSKWLGEKHNIPYVPHIVSLPDTKADYREFIGIPENALVFGRYGGFDQFNIEHLPRVIEYVVNQRPDVYFLLMNTKHLGFDHPRVIYTDATTDLEQKRAFLNTCDAFITGRTDGESFGLSIAEACFANLPVITNSDGRDKNHLFLLKDKGFYYENANELYAILMNFQKNNFDYTQLVKEFAPEIVMQKFKEVFLD